MFISLPVSASPCIFVYVSLYLCLIVTLFLKLQLASFLCLWLTFPFSPCLALFSKGYHRYHALCLTLSVCQCVSVFQGTSRLCRELRFCLDIVCTSWHTSNTRKAWRSSATLKIFISGVSSQILMM